MRAAWAMAGVIAWVGCGPSHGGIGHGRDGAVDARTDDGGGDALTSCEPPAADVVDPNTAAALTVVNEPSAALGIFDPSLVYPAGAPGGALSYSSVAGPGNIATHIALSADAGATWTYVTSATTVTAAVLDSTDAVNCAGGTCSGHLVDETSSLVIDPDDPDANRRWKLFTFRYLVTDADKLRYDYGTLALYTAPAPEGPWSAPTKIIGWPSTSPYSSTDVGLNIASVPALSDCVVLTEPGALWVPGESIDLAVGCVYVEGDESRIRIELLRTTDHAATFTHVGPLLDGTEGQCIGGSAARVNAPNLFFAGGKPYLSVTTETADLVYQGCAILPVEDLQSGKLKRDAADELVATKILTGPPNQFAGACTHAEGTTPTGILMGMSFITDPPRVFRIYKTGIGSP